MPKLLQSLGTKTTEWGNVLGRWSLCRSGESIGTFNAEITYLSTDLKTIKHMLANPDPVAMANVEGFWKFASKTHRNCLDFSGKEIKLIQDD